MRLGRRWRHRHSARRSAGSRRWLRVHVDSRKTSQMGGGLLLRGAASLGWLGVGPEGCGLCGTASGKTVSWQTPSFKMSCFGSFPQFTHRDIYYLVNTDASQPKSVQKIQLDEVVGARGILYPTGSSKRLLIWASGHTGSTSQIVLGGRAVILLN